MGNYIYTIGRELGSGGYTVAKLLAERLGIKLYDKELLAQAAKDSGFCEEIFENHDERPTNSFLYSLVIHIPAEIILQHRFWICRLITKYF